MLSLQLLNLRDNPVFHRFRRSQLRLKASLAWLLLTLIVTTFVITLPYLVQTNDIGTRGFGMETTPQDLQATAEAVEATVQRAARRLWIPLLIIQGLILLLKGTGRTASGLIQDKIDQTLDYQRLTPLPPLKNVIGYLFGLPLLEYAMFALTLPHLAFIVIKGNIPLLTVLAVYTSFFVCAIFYHMTAIAVGMVMKRWIFGYLLSIFAVAFLNLILAPLGSQFGLKFMQYLSVFPVIGQKVAPLLATAGFAGGPRFVAPAGPGFAPSPFFPSGPEPLPPVAGDPVPFNFADPVPFFDWMLSPFLFTLLLQGSLIVTFATMAVRRWQKADKHSLSKLYALGVLGVFILLVIGNLWPVITGQFLPFMVLGSTSLADRLEPIAIALPLVYSLAVLVLCTFLFFNTVPTHQDYVRGLRRARKHGRKAALPWDDDSASIAFMSLFVLVALIGFAILYFEMQSAGFMHFLEGTGHAWWRLPAALALALVYTLLLLQALGDRGAVLCFLLVWLLPILVAIVAVAAMEEFTRFHAVVASISPLATVVGAGLLPIAEAFAPVSEGDEIAKAVTGLLSGLGFMAIQIVVLGWRWHRLRSRLQ